MNIRRTEMKMEIIGSKIIRAKSKPLSAHCEKCLKTVAAFAPKKIAAIFRLNLAEVCRRIETDELHLIEIRRGVAQICGSSLGQQTD